MKPFNIKIQQHTHSQSKPKNQEVTINADGSGGPISTAPAKSLEKVVKQLKGASKMHAAQADMVQDHIDEMKEGSPVTKHCKSGAKSIAKKKDKCYYKAKAKYDVFPSAYASGYIAKCRKRGGNIK